MIYQYSTFNHFHRHSNWKCSNNCVDFLLFNHIAYLNRYVFVTNKFHFISFKEWHAIYFILFTSIHIHWKCIHHTHSIECLYQTFAISLFVLFLLLLITVSKTGEQCAVCCSLILLLEIPSHFSILNGITSSS